MESREIKFRGLRIDGKGWVYGCLINWHPTLNPRIIWYEEYGETDQELDLKEVNYEVIPESVGQFVGLIEKTGIYIYEGDIWNKLSYPYKTIIVEIDNGKCNICDYIMSKGKVVGNIHQNPELL